MTGENQVMLGLIETSPLPVFKTLPLPVLMPLPVFSRRELAHGSNPAIPLELRETTEMCAIARMIRDSLIELREARELEVTEAEIEAALAVLEV